MPGKPQHGFPRLSATTARVGAAWAEEEDASQQAGISTMGFPFCLRESSTAAMALWRCSGGISSL